MPARGARILIVDDDPEITEAIRRGLAAHGYATSAAATAAAAIAAYRGQIPDVILLDLGLPDADGIAVLRWVRERGQVPVIVLSARHAEATKVEALTLGTDDYLQKPFGMNELRARIQVALRHAARPESGGDPVFRSGDLAVDFARRLVTRGDEAIHLTPTEYDLLKALVSHPDKVLTHRMLLNAVWGGEAGTDTHYLHVYMGQLRRKIEADPARPRHLLTEPGAGYRFQT